MKRIGIITMHAVRNYGSYLQTYALYKYLESLGHEVFIIDYKFPLEYHKSLHINDGTKTIEPKWIEKKIAGLCSRIVKLNPDLYEQRMASFYKDNINFTRPYESIEALACNPPIFDVYITGSDQVWNPYWVGVDTNFLLSWVEQNKLKISYAASFAIKELPEKYNDLYCKYLRQYNYISIREESDILKKMGLHGQVVLDPTFLLDKYEWQKIIPSKPLIEGKYILCYLLRYSYDPYPYANKVITWVKKKLKCKVIIIGPEVESILKGNTVLPNCGPIDFLNLFFNASFVITSSFHGTSFAINFQKNFFTIIDDKKTLDNRQVSLINMLSIPQSCVVKKIHLLRI